MAQVTEVGQKYKCRDCGKMILAFRNTLEILHEAPICEAFKAKCLVWNGENQGAEMVEVKDLSRG